MELYVLEHDKYEKLYNCTNFNVDVVPLLSRRNISLGVIFITMGLVYEVMYALCMIVIWRRRKYSCFKIMFYMGILDMLVLTICAIGTGLFCIIGAVFCSYPRLIYAMGVAINFFWPAESTVEILLAIDRCMEMCQPKWGKMLFKGHRTWYWMVPITFYGFFMASFVTSFIFSGLYSTWFFYPYIGYFDDYDLQLQYSSLLHDIHDWVIAVTIPIIYISLGFYLFTKKKSLNPNLATSEESSQQSLIFIQVALISVFNSVASLMYVYLQYSTSFSPAMALVAQFAWIQAHGIPPVIYLLINKSMRHECKGIVLALFGCRKPQEEMLTSNGTHCRINVISGLEIKNYITPSRPTSGKV